MSLAVPSPSGLSHLLECDFHSTCLTDHSVLRPNEEISARLLTAQADSRNVAVQDLKEAELQAGIKADDRVSAAQMDALTDIYAGAQRGFFSKLLDRAYGYGSINVLLAPTSRVVDHIIGEEAMFALTSKLIADGQLEPLKRAINDGPPDGGVIWEHPESPVEMLAGILRWSVLREGDKKRIRVSGDLRSWIGEALEEQGSATKARLGGVTAVGTLLSGVLEHTPTMVALGALPPEIPEHLPPGTRVVGSDATHHSIEQLPKETKRGGHYCLSFYGKSLVLPDSLETLQINGQSHKASDVRSMDILITGSGVVGGFEGVAIERMEKLGRSHELMILSGIQSLSRKTDIVDYFNHVEAAHSQGMPVALLYSESKFPDSEVEVWSELRKRKTIEFLGMNTGEAFDVLKRIQDSIQNGNPLRILDKQRLQIEAALDAGSEHGDMWTNGRESPRWLFRSAAILQEILEIPAVRVRGKATDVLIVAEGVNFDKEDTRDSMVVSRNMGTIKTANPAGLIASPDHLSILKNVPNGDFLAALHSIADELRSGGARPEECARIPHQCYAELPDGRACLAIPPIPFYDRSGGTQSAGDTIDVTFATEEVHGLLSAAYQKNATPGH